VWLDGSDVLYADWNTQQVTRGVPYVRFGAYYGHWGWATDSEKNAGYICEWDS